MIKPNTTVCRAEKCRLHSDAYVDK